MKPAGYRLASVTVNDDVRVPRVAYFEPVDAAGRKCGDQVRGTLPADKVPPLGAVLKALPKLGKYKPPK